MLQETQNKLLLSPEVNVDPITFQEGIQMIRGAHCHPLQYCLYQMNHHQVWRLRHLWVCQQVSAHLKAQWSALALLLEMAQLVEQLHVQAGKGAFVHKEFTGLILLRLNHSFTLKRQKLAEHVHGKLIRSLLKSKDTSHLTIV